MWKLPYAILNVCDIICKDKVQQMIVCLDSCPNIQTKGKSNRNLWNNELMKGVGRNHSYGRRREWFFLQHGLELWNIFALGWSGYFCLPQFKKKQDNWVQEKSRQCDYIWEHHFWLMECLKAGKESGELPPYAHWVFYTTHSLSAKTRYSSK